MRRQAMKTVDGDSIMKASGHARHGRAHGSDGYFVTAFSGMPRTGFPRDSPIMNVKNTDECDPHRPCPTGLVVLLSPDLALAKGIEEHLHRAGYAVRVADEVSELLVVMDPKSLLLVLVDHRIRDWQLLRTDHSFRHVLLMKVVPSGCVYTEDRWIADLERGMDGVHDMQDGHCLLVAKVGAYLRRVECDRVRRTVYQVGAVELDGDTREVKIAGRQVKLSAKPFAILKILMHEPSKVVRRSELVNLVWGLDFAICKRALDTHVHTLRQQLGRESHPLCELITIKRIGFKLKPVSSAGTLLARKRHQSTLNPISVCTEAQGGRHTVHQDSQRHPIA